MAAKNLAAAVAVAVSAFSMTACVQYPTERSTIVDIRPQISFRFDETLPRLSDARVLVDGLDAGRAGDFVDGRTALRLLPGTHVLRVVSGSDVLLEERIYLGDGAARPFVLK